MQKNKLSITFLIFSGLFSFNAFALPSVSNIVSRIDFPPLEKKTYTHDFPINDPNQKIKHKEFKNMVIFGDSLSEVGSFDREHRYLAGGFDNKMGTEILSEYYTGKASAPPSTKGGQNHAVSGAVASNNYDPRERFSLSYLIDEYLKFNNITNNKINPENLYFIWIGAMDINLDLLNKPLSILTYDFKAPEYTINIAPLEVTKQAKRLLDMGAKYLMVVNLPDSATAPITAVFYTDVINSALQSIPIINNLSELYFGKRRAQVDRFLRNPDNRVHINGDKGKEYLIENGILGMQKLYFFLPKALVKQLYMFAYNIQSDLTRQFSTTLNENLAKINGPIVYVDFRKANYELIEDPQKYGIDDIISPTCTLGYSARLCDKDSPKYFDDKVYLTSDWFHPSPYANRLLADYVIGIFDAPLYVSSIIKHQKLINDLRSDFLQNQLNILMHSDNEINKLIPFFGYSGQYNVKEKSYLEDDKSNFLQNFNLGVTYYLNKNNLIGTMLNAGYGRFVPHHNFNYHYNNQSLTLFTQTKLNNNLWLNANVYAGRLSLSDIMRTIPLGPVAKEFQRSSTNGKSYGFNAVAGFNININENVSHSPIIGIALNSFNAKKFRENSDKSNAMHFDPERFKFDYVSLGWKLNSNNNPINTSLDITFNRQLSNKPVIVNGAVNSTETSFFREYQYNKNWVDVKTGLNKNINDNTNIGFNLGLSSKFKKENHKEQSLNLSIGLISKF